MSRPPVPPWVYLSAGAVAVGGFLFVYFWFPSWVGFAPRRLSDSGEPITPQLPNPMDLVSKVRNRVLAAGTHDLLQAALDEYEKTSDALPPIRIGSGVRTDAQQLILWQLGRDAAGNVVDESKKATNAQSATSSAHGVRSGKGNAFDFDPIPATVANYQVVGEWFEARGLEWGGRWTRAFPPTEANPLGGDRRHVNVVGWDRIPV